MVGPRGQVTSKDASISRPVLSPTGFQTSRELVFQSQRPGQPRSEWGVLGSQTGWAPASDFSLGLG